jgi:hypothetical protein
MLFREITAVYSENHKKHTDIFCGQNFNFFMLKQAHIAVMIDKCHEKLNHSHLW